MSRTKNINKKLQKVSTGSSRNDFLRRTFYLMSNNKFLRKVFSLWSKNESFQKTVHSFLNLLRGNRRRYQKELDRMTPAITAGIFHGGAFMKIFEKVDDDFWYWLFTDGYDNNTVLRQALPGLPDKQVQVNFIGRSGHLALWEAFEAYRLFKTIFSEHSKDIRECSAIMDFGCGWGRIIRFFMKDVDAASLWGVDCYPEMLDICKNENLRCNLDVIDPMPPTRFQPETFDLIYLYSVFSHLSEKAHLLWLKEFRRILKPSGMVIATTRPRSFIHRCIDLRKQNVLHSWEKGAAVSFEYPEQDLEDYDAGRFVHSATGGGGVLEESFYGESCIPQKYVENTWTRFFLEVGYIPADTHKRFDQDVIFAKK